MKQNLILTCTTCKTEIPFSKIYDLTEKIEKHIFEKKKKKGNSYILNTVVLIIQAKEGKKLCG